MATVAKSAQTVAGDPRSTVQVECYYQVTVWGYRHPSWGRGVLFSPSLSYSLSLYRHPSWGVVV
jgi:hypothetical protein